MVKVASYKREPYRLNGKLIKPGKTKSHTRKKRPKGKGRIISKKPHKLLVLRNKNGEIIGTQSVRK